ncbi:MAG: hypothetical protein ABII12_15230 [Planctomycetota bacterium]
MSNLERVRKLLGGDAAAGPLVGCWYHFPPGQHAPAIAADAHLRHLEQYDLDFLKVMNEVGYPRESLGPSGVLRDVADLKKLPVLPGDAAPFDLQLDLIRRLRERLLGRVAMTSTVFHAWMVLRSLLAPPTDVHRPPVIELAEDPRDKLLTRWLEQDRSAIRGALDAIAATLANFARACIEAGADGIYLATRDDWVDTSANRDAVGDAAGDAQWGAVGDLVGDARCAPSGGENLGVYDALVAETDRRILRVASDGWFNWLHLCGKPLRFTRHLAEPNLHVVHWADRVTGPPIAEARTTIESVGSPASRSPLVIAAGVDNLQTLPTGSANYVAAEVRDAKQAAAGHPLIIAPGCTYDPETVPAENIRAMVEEARRRQK